jgi:hypothetical protein
LSQTLANVVDADRPAEAGTLLLTILGQGWVASNAPGVRMVRFFCLVAFRTDEETGASSKV